jgi:hypothetical protein
MDAKNVEKAFHTSPTAAIWDSEIDPSTTRGAIFAIYSIKPGINKRAHSRSVAFADVDAKISVFAQ